MCYKGFLLSNAWIFLEILAKMLHYSEKMLNHCRIAQNVCSVFRVLWDVHMCESDLYSVKYDSWEPFDQLHPTNKPGKHVIPLKLGSSWMQKQACVIFIMMDTLWSDVVNKHSTKSNCQIKSYSLLYQHCNQPLLKLQLSDHRTKGYLYNYIMYMLVSMSLASSKG